ncbi:uncharacterized protein LOC124648551 [Lolium rigidum]|uniref:uncharacterized protein LOC124648551 n=1 Tax=Lolium rigidum TaxID=89674 RepID=UPI001F5D90DA|nr:uncharacterized protein LOC124648551 [Lolium rigidum]
MTGKMDKTTKIVVAVVGSLGLLSTIMGFSAEGTKLTASDVLIGDGACYYPRNSSLALAICAALFLVVAQVIFAAVGGCCGCCKSRTMPSEKNRIIGVVCAVVSWIAAVIAFALFVDGAAVNGEGLRETDTFGQCFILKDGIFAGAAILTLAATALGITSYVLLGRQTDAAAAAAPKAGGGIAMGQPQFPQQSPPQWYGQAPPPNYPQYPPPPAQGYGAHPPNQQFPHPQGHAQV